MYLPALFPLLLLWVPGWTPVDPRAVRHLSALGLQAEKGLVIPETLAKSASVSTWMLGIIPTKPELVKSDFG